MTARLAALGLASAGMVTLAACSSTTSGTPASHAPVQSSTSQASSAPASASAATSSSAPKQSHGFPADVKSLGSLLVRGSRSVHTAHVELRGAFSGQHFRGTGDEVLNHGKAEAADFRESFPGLTKLRFRLVNGKVYVQLPASLNHSGKPWQLVSATSSNPVLRQLGQVVGQSLQSTTMDYYADFVRAADQFRLLGRTTIDGAPAGHYRFDVDVAKLPDTFSGKQQLLQAGVTKLPVELWVDSQGRTRKFAEDLNVSGVHTAVQATVSHFGKPVHITAPPARQVSTK